jgi:hypothetical protein
MPPVMRSKIRIVTMLVVAAAMAGAITADAAAQQTAKTPKPATAPSTPPTEAGDDLFIPPLRGTPNGRISGGTRGLGQAAAQLPPQPTNPAPHQSGTGKASLRQTPDALLPAAD